VRITKRQLRRLIREALLLEGGDVTKDTGTSEEKAVKILEKGLDITSGVESVKKFLNSEEGSDPKVREVLGKGDPATETIAISNAQPSVSSLNPTQNEISLANSIGYPLSDISSLHNIKSGDPTGGKTDDATGEKTDRRIVTAGDLVIDGHHRWSQVFSIAGKSGTILAKDINLPGKGADEKLAAAQVGVVATMGQGPVPSAAGSGQPDNILGTDAAGIKSMILAMAEKGQTMENGKPLLGDEYVEEAKGDGEAQGYFGVNEEMTTEEARDKIADVVSSNLASLPGPVGPAREHMPQFGISTKEDDVFAKMAAGTVNFKADFEPDEPAEEEETVSERWQRLAGLIRG